MGLLPLLGGGSLLVAGLGGGLLYTRRNGGDDSDAEGNGGGQSRATVATDDSGPDAPDDPAAAPSQTGSTAGTDAARDKSEDDPSEGSAGPERSVDPASGPSRTVTASDGSPPNDAPSEEPPDDTASVPGGTVSPIGPPDRVPTGPDVSVTYEALVDEEPIGAGGNADVIRATLVTNDGEHTLAIKKPRMGGTLHTDVVERMLAEAETWDRLDAHDHIVDVVDYGSSPVPWIAMEYMDGGHLGERMDQMDVAQRLWTAVAVTRAVRYAHRHGVAHLDLKPANVLFRSVHGAWDVPKVGDWGLSKHLLEHSKSIEGLSPQYAAPEQFDDEYGTTDDVTDVYQLGAVFYELFTGRPPFEGDPAKVMHQVLHEEPTPPSEVADVPPGLDAVLLTALAKERDARYDSVVYLRDALQELDTG